MRRKLSNRDRQCRLETARHGDRRRRGLLLLIALCSMMVFLVGGSAHRAPSTADADDTQPAEILTAYGKLPIQFTENRGQYPDEVRFCVNTRGGTIYFTPDGVIMQFIDHRSESADARSDDERMMGQRRNLAAPDADLDNESHRVRGHVIRKRFIGADPNCRIEGRAVLPGKVNIFRGNDPSEWNAGIPT